MEPFDFQVLLTSCNYTALAAVVVACFRVCQCPSWEQLRAARAAGTSQLEALTAVSSDNGERVATTGAEGGSRMTGQGAAA